MTRVRANLLLLVAAFIWGNAFVAQATAMDKMGPYAFVGVRFLLSAIAVLPFALLERRRGDTPLSAADRWLILLIGIVFLLGNVLQQVGIKHTTVTNAGFLTGLYVVMVPFMAWAAFRMPPNPIVWPAAMLSIFGTFLLGGGGFDPPGPGDLLVVSSAVLWAVHVTAVGVAVMRTSRPLLISVAQFALCGILSLAAGIWLEPLSMAAVVAALPELLYAGLVSGGIGFTLQVIAQRWAPPADAAVILSAEALFAALAGGVLLGERLGLVGWSGAASIFCAILIVQLVPLMRLRASAP
ncbi:DMT family transporter [Lutibaculum baratangense]|uniref:Permease of the drug/metabolite transporter (DMT) superfamily n=1 Tax=Lutibaculum baratangense AMV1 TaxID=631454 RepID=V4TMD4_9HYPH|nr:DMT family transporter [Lutibaculum baratangense]ESR26898.1 Permease of the drug/metabolite transporter (DMT) superfamily [Lutibaculum baratangense AMV1]